MKKATLAGPFVVLFLCASASANRLEKHQETAPLWSPDLSQRLPIDMLNAIAQHLPFPAIENDEEFKRRIQIAALNRVRGTLVETVQSPNNMIEGTVHIFLNNYATLVLHDKEKRVKSSYAIAHFAGQFNYGAPIAVSNTGHLAVYDGNTNNIVFINSKQEGDITLANQKHTIPVPVSFMGLCIKLFFNKQSTKLGVTVRVDRKKERVLLFDLPKSLCNIDNQVKSWNLYLQQQHIL